MGSIRRAPRTGRWEARYRDPAGVQRTLTFDRKADADADLARLETQVRRGEWRDPSAGRITFADWVDAYIVGAVNKRATTRARDRHVLRTHFLPSLGRRPTVTI